MVGRCNEYGVAVGVSGVGRLQESFPLPPPAHGHSSTTHDTTSTSNSPAVSPNIDVKVEEEDECELGYCVTFFYFFHTEEGEV